MERAAEELSGQWAYSPEAEQSLIGALLLDNQAFGRIADVVDAGDFYTDDHRAIYRALATTIRAGHVADLVTVAEALRLENEARFHEMGGAAYLAQLAQSAPSTLNAHRYAELVHEKALYRRLDALGQDLSRLARVPAGRNIESLVTELQARAGRFAEASAPWRALRASNAADFVARDFPPLEPLLLPFLFQKNLLMVHAKRGVGKTHFALGCAWAIATGGKFLGWSAPKPRGVLYVDGEMPAQLMQRRLHELASSSGDMPELFRLVTPDEQGKPMPDLATNAGQADLDALVNEDTALIVVDNLSCLVRSGGAENESESWGAVSEWALKHRRAGRAVLFVHHSGKTGAQRGTSKREDLLDVVVNLRRPPEYQDADGAVFEVHFEKARSLSGDEIAPIEAKLEQLPGAGHVWTWSSAATRTQDRIKTLWEGGTLTLIDVMREACCSKSHAHKTLEAAMLAGELKRDYPQKSRSKTSKETK